MTRDIYTLNHSAGAAVAVGVFSLFNALALLWAPDALLRVPQLVWLFKYVPQWLFAAGHFLLAVALFLSVQKESRLLVAMVASASLFACWALLMVLPAMFGVVERGDALSFGAYAFATAYAAFWAARVHQMQRGREGHHGK